MRAGAGWVRAAVPASLNPIFEVKLTEVMTVPLPEGDGGLAGEPPTRPAGGGRARGRRRAGPGAGPRAGLVGRCRAAGGERGARWWWTPTPSTRLRARAWSAWRLAGRRRCSRPMPASSRGCSACSSADVAAHRHRTRARRSRARRAPVVLKGDDTLVVESAEARSPSAEGNCPALATAGTGDVLSGVLAAFLARGIEPFTAAGAAVCAHVEAGRVAARRLGSDSVIASDVIEALPAVLRDRWSDRGGAHDSARLSGDGRADRAPRQPPGASAGGHGCGPAQLHAPERTAWRATLCAVVKADGYGHGAAECARAALAGGATWLAVATAARGRVAETRWHRHARLLVMGALIGDELDAAVDSGADVVCWSREFADARRRARSAGTTVGRPREARHGYGPARNQDPREAVAWWKGSPPRMAWRRPAS